MSNLENEMVSPDPLERLITMVIGRESTIENTLQLLDAADQKGLLKMAGYLFHDMDELAEAGVGLLAKPETLHMMATGSKWLSLIKSFDPEMLGSLVQTVSQVAGEWESAAPTIEVRGAWDLVKALRDPDVSYLISKVFSVMKTVGASMREGDKA